MAGLLAAASDAAKTAGLLSGQAESADMIPGVKLKGAVSCLPGIEGSMFKALDLFIGALKNSPTIKGCLLPYSIAHDVMFAFEGVVTPTGIHSAGH